MGAADRRNELPPAQPSRGTQLDRLSVAVILAIRHIRSQLELSRSPPGP
jgi:hypothetical protein